jgi:hypothetical protein
MADLYTTNTMLAIVRDLKVAKSALLDRYFNNIQQDLTEEIHFDVEGRPRKLAPFVSPYVDGKIVEESGFTTKTFKPAYVKPKTPIDPKRPLKRWMGERLGGDLSPAEREMAILASELENHIRMVRRRLEWMATQALLTGGYTVSGDKYPTVAISFGRNAGHTVTLTGNDLWTSTNAASNPPEDLQVWAGLIQKNSGADPIDVIMDPDAWLAFRSHALVTAKLNLFRGGLDSSMQLGAMRQSGLSFKGPFDGFNIFVYQDWYEDDTGTVTPYLPSGTVIMCSDGIEGVQAFGAIIDAEASYEAAVPYYPKSWIEKDPGRRILLTQSAPLVVPYRPDASLCATVR